MLDAVLVLPPQAVQPVFLQEGGPDHDDVAILRGGGPFGLFPAQRSRQPDVIHDTVPHLHALDRRLPVRFYRDVLRDPARVGVLPGPRVERDLLVQDRDHAGFTDLGFSVQGKGLHGAS